MEFIKISTRKISSLSLRTIVMVISCWLAFSCGNSSSGEKPVNDSTKVQEPIITEQEEQEEEAIQISEAMLVSPRNPRPGQLFHVMITGGKNVRKMKPEISGPSGPIESISSRTGDGLPYWRIDEFKAGSEGEYTLTLNKGLGDTEQLSFTVTDHPQAGSSNSVWSTTRSWDRQTESLYAAWVNALFYQADERSSWGALHEVTQNKEWNFLYDHLSLGEDDPNGKNRVIMEPDCADNPFYLRAYFSWKLGLPFGYHVSDRGSLGRAPGAGQWVTNEMASSKSTPVQKFNSFLRMVMNGVHSGTARAALTNENADYYPVSLTREALRPGTVYADPYGHTLILVKQLPQKGDQPGVLLSVDAQPDGTVGIKRFWKGNFLFNTTDVIGEPGFKAFRPIVVKDGKFRLMKSDELTAASGLVPFSLQQKGMDSNEFYQIMERVINPKPLDPEAALLDLINALHEQLMVRVTSVANGEKYMKSHPGEVIPMPGKAAGVFQTGGIWEDYSTPNRDLRLLIAMDAVIDFPDKVLRSPDDFKLPLLGSVEQVKEDLDKLMKKKLSELTVTYTRSNGSEQKLTLEEILNRREAFEMAYNPNDGAEIRWGAPENSEERSTCKRRVPPAQLEKMKAVRVWFNKRLHPPT